jgi:hypothetical protein
MSRYFSVYEVALAYAAALFRLQGVVAGIVQSKDGRWIVG